MTTQDKVSRRPRRVDIVSRNECDMIAGMGAPKGRKQRERDGARVLFANVGDDVIDRLDAGAAELNMSRGAYVERLIREMPVDERGLPPWLAELADAEQLPVNPRKGPDQAAA